MSRFLKRPEPTGEPSVPPRRSVYDHRFPDREDDAASWEPAAAMNPMTGQLEWRPGWERQGWRPLEEFFRGR